MASALPVMVDTICTAQYVRVRSLVILTLMSARTHEEEKSP